MNKAAKLLLERGPLVAKVYRCWVSMRERCRPKNQVGSNACYAGVSHCHEWNDFEVFLNDVGLPPSMSHSIDRINSDLGYYKDNCRWATAAEQGYNKATRKLTYARRAEIVRYLRTSGLSQEKVAAQFGISQVRVSQLARSGLY